MDPLVLLIVEAALLVLTALGALAALVQARTAVDARRDAEVAQAASETARDEAARLAMEANAAFVRQAEAQERTAAAMEASRPRPTVSWTIGEYRPNLWVVKNEGNAVAREAVIRDASVGAVILTVQDAGPRDVGPGDHLSFRHLRTGGGGTPAVGIAWLDPETGEEVSAERKLL